LPLDGKRLFVSRGSRNRDVFLNKHLNEHLFPRHIAPTPIASQFSQHRHTIGTQKSNWLFRLRQVPKAVEAVKKFWELMMTTIFDPLRPR